MFTKRPLVALLAVAFVLFLAAPAWCQVEDFRKEERAALGKLSLLERKFGPTNPQLSDTLGVLSELYLQRWDEFSVVRNRQLEIFIQEHPNHPGPLPGGPFPRIGLPGYNSAAQKPPSLLSTWLNRKTLPELYAEEQIGTAEYEKQLLTQLGEAQKRSSASEETCRKMEKLAAFYCGTTHVPKGEALLVSALAIREKLVGATPRSLLPDLDNLALIYSIEGNEARLLQVRARARAIRKGQAERTQAVPLPVHFHKDTPYEQGSFFNDVIIFLVENKPCVKFEGFSPVTQHMSAFTTPAQFSDSKTLTFSFVDDWGTSGKGRIVLQSKSAIVHLEKIADSPGGINACESWPDHETLPLVKLDRTSIPKKCCNALAQCLLLPGDHHAEEVSARSGERWLAFNRNKTTGVLSERPLKVEDVRDAVIHNRIGKRVSVAGGTTPLFLVRGIAGLKSGTIRCADLSESKQLGPNDKLAFKFAGKQYRLSIRTWKSDTKDSSEETAESNYFDSQEISLSDGKTTQVLNSLSDIHLPPDTTFGPTILWAGDLDRDGKIDLLVNTSHYDNRSEWTLFLSSGAPANKFVRKVAQFVTYGC